MAKDLAGLAAGRFRRGPTGHLFGNGVHEDHEAGRVGGDDAVGDRLERNLEPSGLQSELRFDLLELGDVGVGADDTRRTSVGVPGYRLAAAEDPDPVAVAVAFAILEFVDGDFARVLAIGDCPQALHIVRMDARQPGIDRGVHLLVGGHAAHDAPHARVEGGLGVEAVVPDPPARRPPGRSSSGSRFRQARPRRASARRY